MGAAFPLVMSPFNAPAHLPEFAAALRATDYRFVCITPATHGLVNARPSNAVARNVTDVFGWNRPFSQPVLPPALLAAAQRAGVLANHPGGAISTIRAATLDGLLLLHSAFPTDAADAVFLGPDTYRFANAIAAHLARHRHEVRRAIDLGCGTGAGGLLIARACPDARIVLSDINPAAVAAARVNAVASGLDRVTCLQADLFAGIGGPFDLIVANPPYLVDPAQRTYRHGGGALGAALSLRIVHEALPQLAPGGSLVLYTGSAIVDGHDALHEAFRSMLDPSVHDWHYREADPDVFGEELATAALAGADRIAAVVLEVTRRS